MKKKLLVISLAVALVALIAGGSLAYFMDTDDATNVFTVGSIDIEQHEVFVQNAQLLPVVGTDPADANDNYVEKKVTVENIGINEAYVRTFVAVPAVLDNNGILKLYNGDLATKKWSAPQQVATGVTIENEAYNVYLYTYAEALAPQATTAACLEYVYVDSSIDLNVKARDNNGTATTAYFVANGVEVTDFNVATDPLNVYVATQAVQVRGFADMNAAFTGAFPNHPWASN